jgi:hypothetical protein
LPSDIGIIILTDNFSLKTVRDPIENKNFDNFTILKCLRKNEYSNIILSYYGNLPVTTDFKFYNACKSLFSAIPSDVLHNLMIGELKKRSVKEIEIIASELVPEELKHICLCLDFNQNEYKTLNSFLQKKLKP